MALTKVTGGTIADGTVIASDILDGTITDGKLASTGTMPAWNGSALTDVSITGIDDNATSTAVTLDSSGNMGLGVTPESWHSNYKAIQFGANGAIACQVGIDDTTYSNNAYYDSSNSRWEYIGSSEATQYNQTYQGKHQFLVAPSGTADSAISWTTAMTIDNGGQVTMPSQPAFCVLLSGNQNNLALYGRRKVEFDTERFDQNADFNTSTHEFTAPVTGKYSLHFSCEISDYQGDANFYGWHIETSNEVYLTYEHVGSGASDNSGGGAISVIADMDAGDTAFASIYQHAGSATSDVVYTGTHFSGALIC